MAHQTRPDCVVGSFFEIYEQSGYLEEVAAELNIRIARPSKGKPRAGFPVISRDAFIKTLLENGRKVAIHVQKLELLPWGKGTRERVVRYLSEVLTPGTVIDHDTLDALGMLNTNNFVLSICASEGTSSRVALAWLDVATGEFYYSTIDLKDLAGELFRIQPREVILHHSLCKGNEDCFETGPGLPLHIKHLPSDKKSIPYTIFAAILTYGRVSISVASDHSKSRPSFHKLQPGEQMSTIEEFAASSVAEYVRGLLSGPDSSAMSTPALEIPRRFARTDTLILDSATVDAIELFGRSEKRGRVGTILHMLDKTHSKGGQRMLRSWLGSPSRDLEVIRARQSLVAYFIANQDIFDRFCLDMAGIKDAERSIQRMKLGRGGPTDFNAVLDTMALVDKIREYLESATGFSAVRPDLLSRLRDFRSVATDIGLTLVPQSSVEARSSEDGETSRPEIEEGIDGEDEASAVGTQASKPTLGMIPTGVSVELDELRIDAQRFRSRKAALQEDIQRHYGSTASLKFSGSLGPYIEISKFWASKYEKDTKLKSVGHGSQGRVRYQDSKWSEIHHRTMDLAASQLELEKTIFYDACKKLLNHADDLLKAIQALSEMDVLSSFALVARRNGFVCPSVNDSNSIEIRGGRHPIVEVKQNERGQTFKSNDCVLDGSEKTWLLTGAHFTRKVVSKVGASDDIYEDRSTFMLEMVETATILKEATSKSFIIIDEVGRGTSTLDGVRLAYAVLRYLCNVVRARCLFTTHFHELPKLTSGDHTNGELTPRLTPSFGVAFHSLGYYRTGIIENAGHIDCTYKVELGVMESSYGIEVAKRAGMPAIVVSWAHGIHV
ncbi:DNA mismatch repair ATPase msh1 [Gonapodya sp. JEL0774]|nr:DNA mismatch repair ATPase msh1 [Gonapodya sp. JEL0774]